MNNQERIPIKDRIMSPSDLVDDQGAKILIYGAAGAGKTTLCATAPGKILVIDMESGLLSVKDRSDIDVIQVKQASEIMEIYQMLRDGELNYDTVCLDSISEMSEILLQQEKEKHKDPRMAYGNVQESVTNVMRSFRDLHMNVVFVSKMEKQNVDNVMIFEPKMVGTKLGQSITYFFDEVLALRVIEDQDDDGVTIRNRWLQTDVGHGYTAKDRSGKLDDFEEANLLHVITKLGFNTNKIIREEVQTDE
jgi:phage nucleotide-binding protein|tara:strand:- start:6421 stop:7167 length:747 start_codon:yes stop_codon:yes gene_type:complete